MRLMIDAGNTRLKWHLLSDQAIAAKGTCRLDELSSLDEITTHLARVDRVAVSTVMSDDNRQVLSGCLKKLTSAPVNFYWSEAIRGGLKNSYKDVHKMGADRWHAMYAGWSRGNGGFAIVDAGSAVTVDYVRSDGCHQGGYILAGKQMMLRSLQQDAARIGFEAVDARAAEPGASTTECVQQGMVWLWESLIERLRCDCSLYELDRVLITGGDSPALIAAGLIGEHCPDVVLEGLAAVDAECNGL